MMMPTEEEWRRLSDQIIATVSAAPAADQLRIFKEQLALLPEQPRKMVEHFVLLAITFKAHDNDPKVAMSKHFHLSVVSTFTLVVTLVLIGGGLYLVSLSGDDGVSKIDILGAAVETNSVGVACFALAALTFLFTIRSVVSKM
ncbi:hypothetical protein [Rhizobium sp. A37_96]